MSSHQLHRVLGVTYKTAWFMTHRIREAMKKNPSGLLGGGAVRLWKPTKPTSAPRTTAPRSVAVVVLP
jgi:hypothetical protein